MADPISLVRTINGKTVDYGKALPLTVGDFRVLGQRGISTARIAAIAGGGEPDLDVVAGLVRRAAEKANQEVTEADVDTLTLDEIGNHFVVVLSGMVQGVDRTDPTSATSSSSPSDGAGGQSN
jgi:hypothetical protein